jgi:polyhydroxyalkanoate synthesis regulator phasin
MTHKTKVVKTIENGTIRYKHVPVTVEDLLEDRDKQIVQLKKLVDSLREQITQLEQEKQRYQLRDAPADEASSYNIYK